MNSHLHILDNHHQQHHYHQPMTLHQFAHSATVAPAAAVDVADVMAAAAVVVFGSVAAAAAVGSP